MFDVGFAWREAATMGPISSCYRVLQRNCMCLAWEWENDWELCLVWLFRSVRYLLCHSVAMKRHSRKLIIFVATSFMIVAQSTCSCHSSRTFNQVETTNGQKNLCIVCLINPITSLLVWLTRHLTNVITAIHYSLQLLQFMNETGQVYIREKPRKNKAKHSSGEKGLAELQEEVCLLFDGNLLAIYLGAINNHFVSMMNFVS